MKKRWWLLALGLTGVAVWWGGVGSTPGPRLQVENYPQVQVGMTRAEVEALLGGPPGDYGRNMGGPTLSLADLPRVPPGGVDLQIWRDDEHKFDIYFDARGCVAGVHERGHKRSPPESWFQRLRRRIEGPPPAGPVYVWGGGVASSRTVG